MNDLLIVLFWLCAGLVAYACVGYPLLLGMLAWLRPRPIRCGPFAGSVSVVLAAHNEEAGLSRRLEELQQVLGAAGYPAEIIVVSDGSTDQTVEIARKFAGVRVLELPENVGKAAA